MAGWTPASATAEPAEEPWSGTASGPGNRLVALLRTRLGVAALVITLAILAVAALADLIAPFDPLLPVGPSLAPPSSSHLMGTDDLGRDLFSGVVHGTRTSTIIALGVGALAVIIGTLVGTIAGYRGGLVDDILMRITEFFQVLPRFFVAVLAIALFGAGLDSSSCWASRRGQSLRGSSGRRCCRSVTGASWRRRSPLGRRTCTS